MVESTVAIPQRADIVVLKQLERACGVAEVPIGELENALIDLAFADAMNPPFASDALSAAAYHFARIQSRLHAAALMPPDEDVIREPAPKDITPAHAHLAYAAIVAEQRRSPLYAGEPRRAFAALHSRLAYDFLRQNYRIQFGDMWRDSAVH